MNALVTLGYHSAIAFPEVYLNRYLLACKRSMEEIIVASMINDSDITMFLTPE